MGGGCRAVSNGALMGGAFAFLAGGFEVSGGAFSPVELENNAARRGGAMCVAAKPARLSACTANGRYG